MLKSMLLGATALVLGATVVHAEPDLEGYKGLQLRGSIFCTHPNIIKDLAGRIESEIDYSYVFRVYAEQGYCHQRDIVTVLVAPILDYKLRTWEGNLGEAWTVRIQLDNGDGTYSQMPAAAIVFPKEMVYEGNSL